MKQFINPVPNGGLPFFAEDAIMLHEEVLNPFLTLLYGVDSGANMILSGLAITNINSGAGTCDISAGYVYLDGYVRYLAAYTGSYIDLTIKPSAATYTQRLFEDEVTRNAIIHREAEYEINASPTGSYITVGSLSGGSFPTWEAYRFKEKMSSGFTTWKSATEAAYTEVVLSITGVLGGGSFSSNTTELRYKKIGKMLFFDLLVDAVVSGNITSFQVNAGAVFTKATTGNYTGGACYSLQGKAIQWTMNSGSGVFQFTGMGNANPDSYINVSGGTSINLRISGVMEIN